MFLLGKLGGAALYEFRALGYEKDFFHMSEEFMKWTNNVRNGRPHHLSYMQGQGLYIGLSNVWSAANVILIKITGNGHSV